MPHKRNPITCERVAGLARILRGNALAAMENVSLWHERDITHSSVERVIIPDSTILLDYMLYQFTRIVDTLLVYPEHMKENLNKTRGLVFSQSVLLALTAKGISRERAYELVQRNAMRVWQSNQTFADVLKGDPDVLVLLTPEDIDACFNVAHAVAHVDAIFTRCGLAS